MALGDDVMKIHRRLTQSFLASHRMPCQVCGLVLWRHVESVAGHKFVRSNGRVSRA